jgi:hypothetical protein
MNPVGFEKGQNISFILRDPTDDRLWTMAVITVRFLPSMPYNFLAGQRTGSAQGVV